MDGRENTKQGGKGRRRGTESATGAISVGVGGRRIPGNYQPFPSYVQTMNCQYLPILNQRMGRFL